MSVADAEVDVVADWTVDKSFVESTLRRALHQPQLHVLHIDVQDAVAKGDNYASVLVRVTVDFTTTPSSSERRDAVQTRSLIVKSIPKGELMRNFVKRTRFFEKEAHMYEVTLPAIRALMTERAGVDAEHLATDVLLNDRPATIVLDDLRPKGYKMADRRQGLDLQHSIHAIRTLAKLHAASLVLYEQDPASMDFYPETFYTEENRKMLSNHLEGTYNNLAAEVESWPGSERFGDKIRALATKSVDRTMEVMVNREGSLRVLNHGDFWTNNMLFHYDAAGRVDGVKMLDFQMTRFASPALDILYFLYTSPSQRVLETSREQLVGEYHAALCATLRALGDDDADVGPRVTLRQLQQELQDKAYYALVTSVMFSIMVADPDEAPDLSVLTEDNADDGSASTLHKAMAGKIFRKAFERRLPEFEKQGLI